MERHTQEGRGRGGAAHTPEAHAALRFPLAALAVHPCSEEFAAKYVCSRSAEKAKQAACQSSCAAHRRQGRRRRGRRLPQCPRMPAGRPRAEFWRICAGGVGLGGPSKSSLLKRARLLQRSTSPSNTHSSLWLLEAHGRSPSTQASQVAAGLEHPQHGQERTQSTQETGKRWQARQGSRSLGAPAADAAPAHPRRMSANAPARSTPPPPPLYFLSISLAISAETWLHCGLGADRRPGGPPRGVGRTAARLRQWGRFVGETNGRDSTNKPAPGAVHESTKKFRGSAKDGQGASWALILSSAAIGEKGRVLLGGPQ